MSSLKDEEAQREAFCSLKKQEHNLGYERNPNSKIRLRREPREKRKKSSPLNEFKLRGMVDKILKR